MLERRRIDERLEGRSRLAAGLDRAIEAAPREVTAADHRADLPVAGPSPPSRPAAARRGERSGRGRPGAGATPRRGFAGRQVQCLEPVATACSAACCTAACRSSCRRGVRPVHALPAEAVDQLAANLLLEVVAEWFLALQAVASLQHEAPAPRPRDRCRRSRASSEDEVAPGDGVLEVHRRRVAGGRLDQAGEQRGFGDGQSPARLPKYPRAAASTP